MTVPSFIECIRFEDATSFGLPNALQQINCSTELNYLYTKTGQKP